MELHHHEHGRRHRRGGFPGHFGPPHFGPAHFGPGHFGPGHFGPGGGFGPGFPPGGPRGHRGGRARKGDVRAAILSLLADEPSNGYGLIKGIAQRTDSAWRPSPGSVYPTLAQLVDEGLIEPVGAGGPRSDYQLTDAGRSYVEEHADEIGAAWESVPPGDELFTAIGKLMRALRQFATDATPEQREQAVAKVDAVRRELYRMLAE